MSAVSKYISPQEYLAQERASPLRHQYYRGEMFAMSGASRAHNVINLNLSTALVLQLKGRPCEAYANDMRVKVSVTGLYTYPDLAVACGDRQFEDAVVDTLLNPTLLSEVLSPTTEAYDRGSKFAQYRQLASLREFLLIAQDQVSIEQYVREEEKWVLTTHNSLDDVLDLASIGCRVSLREIYDRVEFAPPARPEAATGANS